MKIKITNAEFSEKNPAVLVLTYMLEHGEIVQEVFANWASHTARFMRFLRVTLGLPVEFSTTPQYLIGLTFCADLRKRRVFASNKPTVKTGNWHACNSIRR